MTPVKYVGVKINKAVRPHKHRLRERVGGRLTNSDSALRTPHYGEGFVLLSGLAINRGHQSRTGETNEIRDKSKTVWLQLFLFPHQLNPVTGEVSESVALAFIITNTEILS